MARPKQESTRKKVNIRLKLNHPIVKSYFSDFIRIEFNIFDHLFI